MNLKGQFKLLQQDLFIIIVCVIILAVFECSLLMKKIKGQSNK